MSVIAAAVKHLLAAGVTGDALLAAISEMEAQIRAEPKAQTAGAARTQRWRDKKAAEASQPSQTVTCDAGDVEVTLPSLSLLPNENKSNPTTHTYPERDTTRTCEAAPTADECATVISAWNATAKPLGLPVCQKLSPTRRKACQARLRDDGLAAIQQAIQRVPASSFLRGETGDWSGANIDFLLRPDTVTKILEGKYDDRNRSHPGSSNVRPFAKPKDGAIAAFDDLLGLGDGNRPHRTHDAGAGTPDRGRALAGPRRLF